MSKAEEQSSPPPQGNSQKSDDELLKGCLYSLFKFIGLFIAFIGLLFLLADNYDVGSKAFKKGLWPSAVFFLEHVKPTHEDYKDAQEKLKIARGKVKQQEEEKP